MASRPWHVTCALPSTSPSTTHPCPPTPTLTRKPNEASRVPSDGRTCASRSLTHPPCHVQGVGGRGTWTSQLDDRNEPAFFFSFFFFFARAPSPLSRRMPRRQHNTTGFRLSLLVSPTASNDPSSRPPGVASSRRYLPADAELAEARWWARRHACLHGGGKTVQPVCMLRDDGWMDG